jgi:hypothetical protein
MNNGSKGRCVTITPQASNEGITWLKAALGASKEVLLPVPYGRSGLTHRKPGKRSKSRSVV